MYTISIFYGAHDSSVSFATDDEIIAHCEAERWYGEKHKQITNTIDMCMFVRKCMNELKIYPHQISKLIVNPLNNPDNWGIQPAHLGVYKPYVSYDHHSCHIATVLNNTHDNCLVLVADGDCELSRSTTLYHQDNGKTKQLENATVSMANGSIYGTMTHLVLHPDLTVANYSYTGKFMGLSAYGEYDPHIASLMKQNYHAMIHTNEGYSSDVLYDMFNLSPDHEGYSEDPKRLNFCHTGQKVWCQAVIDLVERYKHLSDTICVTGGSALNVVLNSELTKIFKRVITTPVPSDCGQSLGGLLVDNPKLKIKTPFLGIPREECDSYNPLMLRDLEQGKVIAWVRGASEIGPRALGHRSILANPAIAGIRDKVNQVKGREWYRPVAPVVPLEELTSWFDTTVSSPYMSFAPQATQKTRTMCPDAVHVDGTCRVQTVDKDDDPVFHQLLSDLGVELGIPMVLNTSFNLAGETLVESFEDALDAFNRSEIEVLYINKERHSK